MAPSLLAPDVSNGKTSAKTSAKTSVTPGSTTPESSCEYTHGEIPIKDRLEQKEFLVGTPVSFLRPTILPDCINMLRQGHKAYHDIDPVLRRRAFGRDDDISLIDYMKIKSQTTSWYDEMARCDFEKIMNDESLQDVLDNCNICYNNNNNNYRLLDIETCYDNVRKLDVVKIQNPSQTIT
tara:strand:+ start:331 stop:870 length:540 start_codon:yes stop_codon:yes gene_type:complete